MKKIICASLLAISGIASAASIFTYTVVTKGDIVAECSDFLGKTSIGGNATLRDFLIESAVVTDCPLEVAGYLKMTRGGISNTVQFTCARASGAEILHTGISTVVNYPMRPIDLGLQMDFVSNKLANTKSSSAVRVKNLTPRDILSPSTIVLESHGDEALVINLSGQHYNLSNLKIVLKGTAKPSKIIWNFHEAQSIAIRNSGVKIEHGKLNVGLPGTILAPNATVDLNNMLVTGAVFAKEFYGHADELNCSGKVSGQVNPDCFRAPRLGIGCEVPRRGGKGK